MAHFHTHRFVLELLKGRLFELLKTVNISKSLFNSHTTSAVIITTMETSLVDNYSTSFEIICCHKYINTNMTVYAKICICDGV